MAVHSWVYALSMSCTDDVKDEMPYLASSVLTFGVHANDLRSSAEGRVVGEASTTTTIDLTNISDRFLGTLDYTGKKVFGFAFKNTGTGNVTVAPGGTNGYQFLSGGPSIVVPPGGSVYGFVGTNAPSIGTSSRNISITVSTNGKLQYLLLIGGGST